MPVHDHLAAALERAVPNGVRIRPTDRLAHAHDASPYLLTPQAVVVPRSTEHVASLLQVSAAQGVPLAFRSGGTSLSGQAGTDGVLVETRSNFRSIEVLDHGLRVRVQPGATVRAVNARLAPFGRKLGPDPASEVACTIGGVVANNSSGMACGTQDNSYHTLESAVLVLPSGTVLDTGEPGAADKLRHLEPHLFEGLARLRDRVRGNPSSVATVQRLFSIKNTMGYSVNAFLDHDDPLEILTRLVVGSEGTLAFVAEVTFHTVAAHPAAATGLLVFDNLSQATATLPDLVAAGFATLELLDATSLRVSQRDPHAPADLRALDVLRHAALLVEHQAPNEAALMELSESSSGLLASLPLRLSADLSTDAQRRSALWAIRKGLFTAVAGARPSGSTALLEDVAVPVDALLPTCEQLTDLFDRHGYQDSVIFGHAKDGNVHFLINERFDQAASLARYRAFTDDMVDLVLDQGGTLKAEHGTGRAMAPFVGRQYGEELHQVMREIKALFDPHGLLAPGVLLDDLPLSHLQHLKTTPTVEPEVDRCVECGYCEPVCPSRALTTTPRQRIVLRRELARARDAGDEVLAATLESEFQYDGIETCAVDGMCSTACPVQIDTGDLTRRLRTQSSGRAAERGWALAADHWSAATRTASRALTAASAVPPALPRRASDAARAVLGADTVPRWSPDLPSGGTPRRPKPAPDATAVFFPACITTMFGPAVEGGAGVRDAFLTLCDRAGVRVRVPDEIGDLCCGTPWKSKGFDRGFTAMRERVVAVLAEATEHGRLPVIVDAASCTEGLRGLLTAMDDVVVVDAVAFVDDHVLPHLSISERVPSVMLHPTCSSVQLGLEGAMRRVAGAVADVVLVPDDWGCCGFAGDRGLLHPELTESATADQARSVRAANASAHASVNRTCELGMTKATGHPYVHLLELLAVASAPR